MPSIYDPARRQELRDRLAQLTPERAPRWGRFSARQMVTHLLESYRMGAGELRLPVRPLPLRAVVRYLMIHVLPFPRSAPTAPQLLARAPDSWERDVAALSDRIASRVEPAPGAELATHPLFGRMSAADWGVLSYKHTDHHFRQFGI